MKNETVKNMDNQLELGLIGLVAYLEGQGDLKRKFIVGILIYGFYRDC